MRVLAIGPLWRGSNAGGLFRALSREGCVLEVVDEFYFISLQSKTKLTKIAERLIRPRQMEEFNIAIKKKITNFRPDFLLVYKGAFVFADTLVFAKKNNCILVLFYPDVSTTFHGRNIPVCIPLYDKIFTTKTFGILDMKSLYSVENVQFIPHGFDPEIHRKMAVSAADRKNFGCDVSFIGTWSPKKELLLSILKKSCPDIEIKVWGEQWQKSKDPDLKKCLQYWAVPGDLYAIAIQCSKINLGILAEQVKGASSGDLITSRTFHIPGAYGFMLHERNEESTLYYKEDIECAYFDGAEELVEKVKYFLKDDVLREKICKAGHNRALADHSLDNRATLIISELEKLQGAF